MSAATETGGRPAKSLQRLAGLFVVIWIVLQLALPVRALFASRQATAGSFSWNMYASRYDCSAGYTFHPRSGPSRVVDHESFFHDRRLARRIFHRDVLPAFHAYLCGELTAAEPGRLEGYVSCAVDGARPELLVSPGIDVCTARGYGVAAP